MALHTGEIDPMYSEVDATTLSVFKYLLVNRGIVTLFSKLSKTLTAVVGKERFIYQ